MRAGRVLDQGPASRAKVVTSVIMRRRMTIGATIESSMDQGRIGELLEKFCEANGIRVGSIAIKAAPAPGIAR